MQYRSTSVLQCRDIAVLQYFRQRRPSALPRNNRAEESTLRTEVATVLARPKFARYALTPHDVAAVLDALAVADQASLLPELPVAVRDPDDAKFLACALGGRADYLVTGDADLLVLDGQPVLGVLHIVTVRAFLGIIGVDPMTPPRQEPEPR